MRALIAVAFVLACLAALPALGGPIIDVQVGTATVDGLVGEWDLAGSAPLIDPPASDFFLANMYRAFKDTMPLQSKLYLQYDPATGILYSLVYTTAATANVLLLPDFEDDAFGKIGLNDKLVDGDSGNDGIPPDFSWVGATGSGPDSRAWGWEGSAAVSRDGVVLAPGGVYDLNFHVQVDLDGGAQTSGLVSKSVMVRLPEPEFTGSGGSVPLPGSAWMGIALLGVLGLARRVRRRNA